MFDLNFGGRRHLGGLARLRRAPQVGQLFLVEDIKDLAFEHFCEDPCRLVRGLELGTFFDATDGVRREIGVFCQFRDREAESLTEFLQLVHGGPH